MHTHHSHSGSYCAHADPKSTLRDMFQRAIDSGMTVFAMTEHMPRGNEDLYSEELEAKDSAQSLEKRFDDYIAEATRLREVYIATGSIQSASSTSSKITTAPSTSDKDPERMEVLIGLETEYIRPSSLTLLSSLLFRYSSNIDFFLGSVHHVHTIPIDFDHATYLQARAACSPPTDNQLFADYFDAQYEMLQALRPQLVGHFDLIRLLSDEPDADWRALTDGHGNKLWMAIDRNLAFVRSYGGLLEINTSAWRKGLQDPYPRREIVMRWREMGGDVVLSDDSHSVAQVGTNYEKLKDFLTSYGVEQIAFLKGRKDGQAVAMGQGGGRCEIAYVDVKELW